MAVEKFDLVGGGSVSVDLGDHNEPRTCAPHNWELAGQASEWQEVVCTRCGERRRVDDALIAEIKNSK